MKKSKLIHTPPHTKHHKYYNTLTNIENTTIRSTVPTSRKYHFLHIHYQNLILSTCDTHHTQYRIPLHPRLDNHTLNLHTVASHITKSFQLCNIHPPPHRSKITLHPPTPSIYVFRPVIYTSRPTSSLFTSSIPQDAKPHHTPTTYQY